MVRILLLGFCKVEYVQFFKIYFSQEKIQDASDPCLSPVYCCRDCFCKNGIQKNIMESTKSRQICQLCSQNWQMETMEYFCTEKRLVVIQILVCYI